MRVKIFHGWVLLFVCLLCALPRALAATAGPNLIAYVDEAGDLYVIQPDGNGRRKFASGELLQSIAFSTDQLVKNDRDFYTWPVWSSDSHLLACFRLIASEEEATDGLYIFDVASSQVL